jgi:tetratricopeptide (TPR) repeat protein
MTDLTSVEIPKPKDWQALERHCRLLFELSLQDPAVQNNGRQGQRQHGVDIFGRRGGGTGPQVGVQCKGKSSNYGSSVTEAELEDEVEKTKKFQPPLNEFILVTTAPEDTKIQQAVRLLEKKVRAEGRNLSVQVWGWGRVQDEINRFPEALRAFHPDATPFTDKILDVVKETNRLVTEDRATNAAAIADIKQALAQMFIQRPPVSTDATAADALDKELHNQIDGYRDLMRDGQPRTALQLLNRLKDRLGDNTPQRVRYRLLSNIGAAHYNLGEYDTASDFLLEASPLYPDDHISLANKTAALLIKGRKDDAHAVVVAAMGAHPDSQELALQRIQALGPGENVEEVWQSLSEKAKSTAVVFAFRVGVLREAKDDRWIALAAEGCALYPDDEGLKIFRAESILHRLLSSDPGAVGLAKGDVPTQAELKDAAERLEKSWIKSKGQETPAKLPCAHNAALAWHILGEASHAAALLDELIARGYDADETKHLRLAIYRKQGKPAEAIRLSDTLSDTPTHRVMRADLRIDIAPSEARNILADRASYTRGSDIIAAALTVVDTYIRENDFDAALAEAERLAAALPDHPQGPLAHFRIRKARGDEGSMSDLGGALSLVKDDTDFPTRFFVAEALASVERFDDVVGLLANKTSHSFDSPALRALVAAAVNSDRRVLLSKILKELPREVAEDRFYIKSKIALSIRTGDIRNAEKQIREFLKREPDNLELHIQLLHALFRLDKIEELGTEASLPASQFKGQPSDFLKLAHFKDDFGDWREAHILAYETLLANPNSQSVAIGYIGIFLRPGHSRELSVTSPTVENDTAVGLKDDDGVTSLYVIESEIALRPSGQYIAPDHLLAKRLAGKNVGDIVELPDKTQATIIWIKPKVLHALHDVMENFNNRHPEARGLERVRVEPGKEGGFEPMLERVRDRHDAIQQVGQLYDSGAMPIALVGRSLGCDPVEAMVGLASNGHSIGSCDGNHLERETAVAAIDANSGRGCVVDAITLHVIRRLKLEAAVTAVCGPIKIVDESTLRIQRKIHELRERIDEPDMSISWHDGQYCRQDTTPEQKQSILKMLQEDQQWLAANATVVPAEGSTDPSLDWRPLIERFGSEFLDEIRAAEGAGLLLLCEDRVLRGLAKIDFKVPGTWLQPVLMRALDQKIITLGQYREAIVALIDSKFEFISIGADLLVSAIRGTNGHVLPQDFEKLVSRLGGEKADMESHMRVAYGAAVVIWSDRTLSDTLRQGAVGILLERMIADRGSTHAQLVLSTWIEAERLNSSNMHRYIIDWIRGHFINTNE